MDRPMMNMKAARNVLDHADSLWGFAPLEKNILYAMGWYSPQRMRQVITWWIGHDRIWSGLVAMSAPKVAFENLANFTEDLGRSAARAAEAIAKLAGPEPDGPAGEG